MARETDAMVAALDRTGETFEAHFRGAEREHAARRQFAASVDEPADRPSRWLWAAQMVASLVIVAGPTCGSIVGLTMLLAAVFPAGWSMLTALIWTGAAIGWTWWLLRGRR